MLIMVMIMVRTSVQHNIDLMTSPSYISVDCEGVTNLVLEWKAENTNLAMDWMAITVH